MAGMGAPQGSSGGGRFAARGIYAGLPPRAWIGAGPHPPSQRQGHWLRHLRHEDPKGSTRTSPDRAVPQPTGPGH
eukprot:300279-Alexandrium_andersonii.AAC.1